VLKSEFGLPMGLADTSKITVDWDTGQVDKKGKRATIKKDVHRVQILDPATGTGTFLAEAIKQIAMGNAQVRIRLLVLDPARARSEVPRLIELSQRLTSIFAFRTPVEEIDRQYAGAYLISDRDAWYERPLAVRFDGEGNTHAPGRTRQLQESFNAIWERSEDCSEMRRLEI
jgi:hypothetical protein